MNPYHRLKYLILLLTGLYVVGCARVPNASVTLSEELANMIISAEAAHMAMIEEYVSEHRRQTDLFLDSLWIPSFMGRMVELSGVLEDIESAGSPEERGQLLREFTVDAASEITARRESMMDALDKIEHGLKAAVHAHYEDMLMVNAALTAHLRSVAKVTETREELLALLRADPEKILPIDKIDSVVDRLIRYEGKIENIIDHANEVSEILESSRRKEK